MEDLAASQCAEERELYRLSEPIPLTDLMVRRSCVVVSISFALMVTISGFVFTMGWLLPNDPNDRDYLVWGNHYVNEQDKSQLVSKELLVSGDDEQSPLQSQAVSDWTVMVVYDAPPDADNENGNLWTKESLISIREFENEMKALDGFSKMCRAEEVPDGEVDEVQCIESALQSPLTLLDEPEKLEQYSQEQLDEILKKAIGDPEQWKQY